MFILFLFLSYFNAHTNDNSNVILRHTINDPQIPALAIPNVFNHYYIARFPLAKEAYQQQVTTGILQEDIVSFLKANTAYIKQGWFAFSTRCDDKTTLKLFELTNKMLLYTQRVTFSEDPTRIKNAAIKEWQQLDETIKKQFPSLLEQYDHLIEIYYKQWIQNPHNYSDMLMKSLKRFLYYQLIIKNLHALATESENFEESSETQSLSPCTIL